jgi:hypothetical protein
MELLSGVSGVSSELLCSGFIGQLNVSRSSDLGQQSITNSQKCQGGSHKFFWGLTFKKYQSF